MAQIEVEHRGILTKEQFNELKRVLGKQGRFIEEKDRFSIIYSPRGKETLKVHKGPIDLRVRITNKKAEIVLKYGKSSGNDARKEFSFPIESKKFEEATEFLMILGFYYGVLQATKSYLYKYKDIEIVLVEVPKFGYYFEAEILTNSESIKSANKKIILLCQELGVAILSNKAFWKLIADLNKRPAMRFNFKKEKFSDIKKRFKGYF